MRPTRLLTLAASLAALSTASAVDFVKLQNNTALNTAAAWQNNAVPGTDDTLLWNSTYTTPGASSTLSQLGGDLSVSGLKVTNVGGTRNAATTMVGFQNTSSANTLTIGSGGIDCSAAFQALHLQSKITIGASQTWNVANANTAGNVQGFNNNEDLAFFAQVTGAAFNFGGNTVSTTGLGQITFSSGWTLSNGTLNVGNNLLVIQGGSSRTTTVNSNVNLNVSAGSQLRLQGNSGLSGVSLVSNAPVNVSGAAAKLTLMSNSNASITNAGAITMGTGTSLDVSTGSGTTPAPLTNSGTVSFTGNVNWNVFGGASAPQGSLFSGNLTGSGNVTYSNTATGTASSGSLGLAQVRLAGDNSGFTGTITLNGASGNRSLRLNTATSGSASATWSVAANNILQVDGVSVQLGTLNGAGSVTNSHASNPATLLVGAGSFSGAISDGTAATGLTKVGSGVLTLSGANTYTGATTVTQGSLLVATGQSLSSAVSVAGGTTFGSNVGIAGSTLVMPSLSLGPVTGATLEINTGILGNPTLAPLAPASFDVLAPATLKVTGTALTAGTFPAVAFTSATGTGNLSLLLPPRHNGSLIVNGGDVSVNISSVEQVRWNGDVNTTWDTSTPNWKTTVTDTSTAYIQTPDGSDIVNFTDAASGSGPVTVSLSATLSPTGVNASNATRDYTLAGSGKLSGSMTVTKTGAAALVIANTGSNDFTGATTVTEGYLVLGDGTNPGAGSISGPIVNNATLVLNRPDDFTFANTLSGTGTLRKDQPNTATTPSSALATQSAVVLNGGKLALTGNGSIPGVISGAGQLEFASGTILVNGTVPNTNAGLTTVSGTGTILQLGNSGGAALGGDVTVTGTARITPTLGTQLAPTATYTLLGSNNDSYLAPAALSAETVANVVVNSSVVGAAGGQLVMRNDFNVTGTATLTSGVLGVASGHNATLNSVNITATNTTDAILRIAGSSGPSVMNIGPGGITASGGNIQVKFNTNAQDATLNLGGDFTTTGNVIVTNANYGGANLNVINLIGDRAFNIGAATTTTVAPDIGGTGVLNKTGAGTLVLNASCAAAHTGGTNISAGILVVNGTIGDVNADGPTAVLGGTGSAGEVTVGGGGTVAPGDSGVGSIAANALTLGPAGKVALEASANGVNDLLSIAGALTLDGTFTLEAISGYTPALGDSLDLWDAATVDASAFNAATDLVLPALDSGLAWDTSAFTTTGVVTVVNGNPYTGWQGLKFTPAELLDPAFSGDNADPDGDGLSNALEYAFGSEPKSNSAAFVPQSTATSGQLVLSYLRPVGGVSGVTYTVQTVSDLQSGGAGWTTATPVTDYTETTSTAGVPVGFEKVSITFNTAVTAGQKRFGRVFVSF